MNTLPYLEIFSQAHTANFFITFELLDQELSEITAFSLKHFDIRINIIILCKTPYNPSNIDFKSIKEKSFYQLALTKCSALTYMYYDRGPITCFSYYKSWPFGVYLFSQGELVFNTESIESWEENITTLIIN